jgi:inner membrane transporter RhtA
VNLRDLRPVGLVLLSVTSLQLGIAISSTAFGVVGPLGATLVRSIVGAVLLTAFIRPDFRAFSRVQVVAISRYAAALAAMNLFAYLAIDRLPLGVVSSIIMVGPLTVAAWGHRSPVDLLLVVLAGAGVLLLTLGEGVSGQIDVVGIAFAIGAATAFGLYILMGKRVTKVIDGFGGLALALWISAAIQVVPGVAGGNLGAMTLPVFGILVVAGVMATLIPFAAEMAALRTLSMATFGVLLSLEPVAAAVAGLVIRGQVLAPIQIAGMACVIIASAAVLGPRGWIRRFGSYNRELMADPKIQALTNVPLFAGLSAPELASIAAVAAERDVPAGAVLTEEGAPGDEFFVVSDGAVEIRQGGREINRLGPGDFLGEIALLFGGIRTATATAAEPTRVFVLDKAAFDAMLKRQPRIEDKILTAVSSRMRYR